MTKFKRVLSLAVVLILVQLIYPESLKAPDIFVFDPMMYHPMHPYTASNFIIYPNPFD